MTVIDIKNATVVIDSIEIIRDINWTIEPGEHWFVLGENGSGKSTLVNLVMGLSWARAGGSVRVLGNQFGNCNIQDLRKDIGWVSAYLQDWTHDHMPAINVVLSGFDATIGLYRDATADETERAHTRLENLGCKKFVQRRFDTLSSGEQMRVLIARATITDPPILVLDEPCCHLDFKSREQFLGAIDAFATQGENAPTCIMVTHRVEDITAPYQHGLVMKDGAILATGDKNEVLTENVLQEAFGVPIRIHQFNDRYWPYM
jgi:iron complex transport system ATP-binding protein